MPVSKDAYDLMNNTVMPMVKDQLLKLEESSVITVYHRTKSTEIFRSYTVPSTILPATIAFLQQPLPQGNNNNVVGNSQIMMTYAFGKEGEVPIFGSIVIDDPVFIGIHYFELGATVVISQFNALFIGDLAFLAMLIGMNNSSGAHCLMCMSGRSNFNCEHNSLTMRTKESLVQCLEEYMLAQTHPTRKAPPNVKGVNGPGLWDIDPQRIVIPILHCPMGLIDKILETFKHWVNLEVEDFRDDETEATRSLYRLTKTQHVAAIEAHRQAKAIADANPTYPQARTMLLEADKARKQARKAEAAAKEEYEEQVQRHNAKKTSLNQQFEFVYRSNGVKREHYHGGKFNGVNCIRLMGNSKAIVLGKDNAPGFVQLCLQSMATITTTDAVKSRCNDYCRLLGLLDAIWSTVRGQHSGLLPTEEQKTSLAGALSEGKTLWLAMGLSTLQPKWHLTFDGHLLHQFCKYGGLADKSDETIEKGHQTLKQLRDRYRNITSYEVRENCIRRELRRRRSPEIQLHIDKYEAMIKQSTTTKRAADTQVRQDNNKKAKQEKRDACIVP